MPEPVPEIVQLQSIEAFQSAIRKSQSALVNMTRKGANTSVIEKRLHALVVCLHMLEYTWQKRDDQPYSNLEMIETRQVIKNLLVSNEVMKEKIAAGTPQYTLIERRIRAFQLAIQAINNA